MRFIGSKTHILNDINELLEPHLDGTENTFVDLFAGSNVVGQFFKPKFSIISNDIMSFSNVIAKATIELNTPPTFDRLRSIGINNPFQYLQSVDVNKYLGDFVTENYSPAGIANRMYFTIDNAKRIDFARTTIERWKHKELINSNEYYYLLDALIQGIPFISNTTGTYGAYLKHWDNRAYKALELIPSEIIDNGQKNKSYREDALKLKESLSGDIVYIDTPYNSRQYIPNYHVLETIARWDYPKLHGATGQRDTSREKSSFAMKSKAKAAMKELFSSLKFKHVVVSYSTDGIVPENELIDMLRENSINKEVEVKRIPYRKYKSKIVNPDTSVEELLFYFKPKDSLKYFETKHNPTISIHSSISKIRKRGAAGFIKSPLNYIGGKYKLLPQIFPLFPQNIDIFLDLFSGGGNVGINISAKNIHFNDINIKINSLFRYFQGKDPEELIAKINKRIAKYGLSKTNQAGFLKFRRAYNNKPDPLDLYVLVAYSFNYQFRFNNKMEYNNPFGRNRSHFSDRMADNLRRFVSRLNEVDAVFTDNYFTEVDTSQLSTNSFVYADPPYLITTGSYNDGNRGFVNWTEKQEKELYNFLDNLNSRGISFALSNVMLHKGKTNVILCEWAQKYNVHYLNYNYKNASHNTKHSGSTEVLITNY
ncbi:DNA adenine methylase [Oenococcus oeni IOEB_C52]|nr:DNA adenine methylase [Oenococcus oeni IOEB_C52]